MFAQQLTLLIAPEFPSSHIVRTSPSPRIPLSNSTALNKNKIKQLTKIVIINEQNK